MSAMTTDRDYVLGTHDDEITRLGLQHDVWRPYASDAWLRAGFTRGQTLLDLGCGPGWATADLAAIVGPEGRVVGVDRSARFLAAAKERVLQRGLANAQFHELDLEDGQLPVANLDGVWARWVFAFVKGPRPLLERVVRAVRPGGTLVLHEYVGYRGWRLSPPSPEFNTFVEHVITTWRENGGEPDIGLDLPRWLTEMGAEVREMRPLVEITRPSDFFWQWPNAFVEVGLERMVQIGRVSAAEAGRIRSAYRASQAAPGAFQVTPTVIEVIAVRR
jgi:SAM-dependent methyltransferase